MAVALDEKAELIEPLTEGITFDVWLDREHHMADVMAISNVPTVLWIDEDLHVARPNGVAFGTDMFTEFHGIAPEAHMDAIRAWVREGTVDVDESAAAAAVPELSDTELDARLLFRIGAHLTRTGSPDAGAERLKAAAEMVPHDFTIWRAAMPLMGDDPFGDGFFEGYTRWQEAGGAYHGLPGR